MGSSLALMADFKFSHSAPWKYSWQHTFSESTLALNSFKPPRVGRKRTGAILTLFMASFGNSLGVNIHSFCSVVSPLSHTSPMLRLSVSDSNKYVTGFRCRCAKAGRKALQQPASQKDEEDCSSVSLSCWWSCASLSRTQLVLLAGSNIFKLSPFLSLSFVPLSSCPWTFLGWAGSWKEKIWGRVRNGNNQTWQQYKKVCECPFQNCSIVSSFFQLIVIPDHPLFTPPSHIIHSCYSFCWHMKDNWKLLSYGDIIVYQSTTSN